MEGKILIEIREGDVITVYGMEDTDREGDVITVYGREDTDREIGSLISQCMEGKILIEKGILS